MESQNLVKVKVKGMKVFTMAYFKLGVITGLWQPYGTHTITPTVTALHF